MLTVEEIEKAQKIVVGLVQGMSDRCFPKIEKINCIASINGVCHAAIKRLKESQVNNPKPVNQEKTA
jgi:hypothetical protein